MLGRGKLVLGSGKLVVHVAIRSPVQAGVLC